MRSRPNRPIFDHDPHRYSPVRRAFTVVELLVSMAVIGLLVGLLLPAVQSTREAARAVGCQSNLKQVALAVANYEARHGCFPKHGPDHYGVFVTLLPDLGDAAMKVEYDAHPYPPAPYVGPDPSFHAQRPTYLTCPSMVDLSSGRWACYYGNYGWRATRAPGRTYRTNGVITASSPSTAPASYHRHFVHVRAADITDGLSHTALFSERNPSRREMLANTGGGLIPIEQAADNCENSLQPTFINTSVPWWEDGAGYNHLLSPNHNSCAGVATAGSFHPGGCFVSLCDGAVRFTSDSIDRQVWRAVGTRSSNDDANGF